MKLGKKKNNNKLLILIAIIGLFLLKDVLLGIKERIDNIIYPLQNKIYVLGKRLKENTETVVDYKNLIDQMEALEIMLSEKEIVEEKLKKALEENERLRELLEIEKEFKFEYKVGMLSFRQSREMYESFIINAGSDDGIEVNLPVLYKNILIGKTEKVDSKHTVVQMITFQDTVVSAKTEKGALGIVKGRRDEYLVYEPVSQYEVEVNVGDIIITSGLSDIYPKDLLIGEITDIVEKGKDKKEYLIKVPVDILNMSEVFILTEME